MIATELHWDFDRIGGADWAMVVDLLNYWHKTPPLTQLMNHYFKAKGLVLISEHETTDFEKLVLDRSKKLDISNVPSHLQDLLKEAQEGKYARRK